jgi:molybdate transport system regulatory protein
MQSVRFRIDLGPKCSIGPGKIDLLEAIARSGSIRQAARELGMSYRRAWLLVNSMNRSFSEPSTRASVGGTGGGGVELTEFGAELVRRYRSASRRIESVAQAAFGDLAPKVRGVTKDAGRRRIAKRVKPARAR